MARRKKAESPAEPAAPRAPDAAELERLLGLPLTLTIVVAEKTLHLEDVLRIKQGDIIEFEKIVTTPLTVEVHGHPVALGHAVKLGEKFGLKIGSIIPPEQTVRVLGRTPA